MSDLLQSLRDGCIYRSKRWSGDTHSDKASGIIDESATDALLLEAAEKICELKDRIRELEDLQKRFPPNQAAAPMSELKEEETN